MAKRGRPKGATERKNVATLRATPEWLEWVDRVADFMRYTNRQDFIDRAIVEYARLGKYDFEADPPPKR